MKTILPAIRNFIPIAALALAVSVQSLHAQTTAFSYQGRLTSADGTPVTGTDDLQVRLYATSVGGSPLDTVAITGVPINNGLFTISVDFGVAFFNGEERWLEITDVTRAVVFPRQRFSPTPYAIYSLVASNALTANYSLTASNAIAVAPGAVSNDSLAPFTITGDKIAPNQVVKSLNGLTDMVNLMPGSNITFQPMPNGIIIAAAAGGAGGPGGAYWQLSGNAGTVAGMNFLGTTDNQPLELRVNGTRALRLETNDSGAPNVIGGAPVNFAAAGIVGATIGGGGAVNFGGAGLVNSVHAHFGTIGGGDNNTIQIGASDGTIGGGTRNTLEYFASTATIGGGVGNVINDASSSTIGGGHYNAIQPAALYSAIGGGDFNTIQPNACSSTIGGGDSNTIQNGATNSTIGGGTTNTIQASCFSSTIGGGERNTIRAGSEGSTIGGGEANTISNASNATIGGGVVNTSSGSYATVGGGRGNICSGLAATVSGGDGNVSSGLKATVPGGVFNNASGAFSFAAGTRAEATHEGSFVWACGNDVAFPSETTNRFHVYAQQGFQVEFGGQQPSGRGNRWVTIGSANQPARPINTSTGAYLTDTGVWQNSSDRARKTDFARVNQLEVLEKLAALPVQSWRYTNDTAQVRHLGPSAQDFKAAFGVGADDKSIGTVDADGVALAAIQGLNLKMEEKEARITALEAELARLKQMVENFSSQKN